MVTWATVLEILLPFGNVHSLPRFRSYSVEIVCNINEAIVSAYPAIVLELMHFPPLLIRHTLPASDNDVVLEIDRHIVFSRTGDQAARRCSQFVKTKEIPFSAPNGEILLNQGAILLHKILPVSDLRNSTIQPFRWPSTLGDHVIGGRLQLYKMDFPNARIRKHNYKIRDVVAPERKLGNYVLLMTAHSGESPEDYGCILF